MDADEISKELGFPKSTVYRLSRVLVKWGLLEQDTERRGYRLGIRLFEMGSVVQFQRRIGDMALPVMRDLRNVTGETVLLTIIADDKVVVLREIEGTYFLRIAFGEGRVLPIHAGAASKVLLAHLTVEEQDKFIQGGLPRYSETTITDPVALRNELVTIRENGYAFSDQEIDVSARAVAAPVRDFNGGVIAGINLVGPAHRFDEQTIGRYISLVKEHAERISQMMGFGSITPLMKIR